MKTYTYKGKTYKARSKDEVLRRLKLVPTSEKLREVVRVKDNKPG